MLVIIAGPSGVGKNTVIKEIMQNAPNFMLLKTFTTRLPRNTVDDNAIYNFISLEEFQNKIDNNEMLEYENIHGNFYGSEKNFLVNNLKTGKTFLKDIDVKGNKTFKKILNGITPVLSIYLTASKKILEERLINRGESLESINRRLERFDFEESFKPEFDVVIQNINKDKTIKDVLKAINNFSKLCGDKK